MTRGRKRKHNPTIPQHIDQVKLPAGVYWDPSGNGRWYVLERDPDDGKRRARTVAGPAVKLSDLHAIIEQLAGGDAPGTVGYVIEQFEKSTEWSEISTSTRDDYGYCAEIARAHKTKLGPTLDCLHVDRLNTPFVQNVIEKIAKGTPETKHGAGDAVLGRPSKANHLARYLRRLFAWGVRLGHCKTNPADGVKLVKERGRKRMPAHEAYAAVIKFAQERGALKPHSKGSLPPYLWSLMEIAMLCRMRGIEAVRLTDAHASDVGLRVNRVKGSRDSVVRWNPRLRAAWDAALALRTVILARPSNRGRPVPIRAQDRYVFVSESGTALSKAGLDNAFQDLIRAAIEANIITELERFNLHGLKHRGITDTPGAKGDKKAASGHKTDAALNEYDHEVPTVDPANVPEFSGEFSGGSGKGRDGAV